MNTCADSSCGEEEREREKKRKEKKLNKNTRLFYLIFFLCVEVSQELKMDEKAESIKCSRKQNTPQLLRPTPKKHVVQTIVSVDHYLMCKLFSSLSTFSACVKSKQVVVNTGLDMQISYRSLLSHQLPVSFISGLFSSGPLFGLKPRFISVQAHVYRVRIIINNNNRI